MVKALPSNAGGVGSCLVHVRYNYHKKQPGDFPSGPVVKTLCFHCSGGRGG